MNTNTIKSKIMTDFASKYKNASPFVSSGELWDCCIDILTNPILLNNIIFANDLGIPPVRSLLLILERINFLTPDFELTNQESQWIGSLMGFVFKFILGYENQKERCSINLHGVKTATRFIDCPKPIQIIE